MEKREAGVNVSEWHKENEMNAKLQYETEISVQRAHAPAAVT